MANDSTPSFSAKRKKFVWCDTTNPFYITHESKRIRVFPLFVENLGIGLYIDRSMAVDESGVLYMSYWEKDSKSATRGQRGSKIWRVSEKRHHRYLDGLATLERSVRASLFKAEGNTDLLAESFLLCEAIGVQLQGSVSLNELTSKEMLRYLEQFESSLARKSSAPLAEARDKVHSLLLWVRDGEGRPKLVIFRTVWSAILDRHKERIQIIQSWSKVYAARLYEIMIIRERFTLMLAHLKKQILSLKVGAIIVQKMNEEYKNSVLTLTPKFISELSRWRLRPYNSWSSHMIRDIGKLEGAVQGNSRKLTVSLLDKLELSISLKEFQESVDWFNQYLASRTLKEVKVRKSITYAYDQDVLNVIRDRCSSIAKFIKGIDDRSLNRQVMPLIKKLWRTYESSLKKEGASWQQGSFTRLNQHDRLRSLLKDISRLL